MAKLPEVHVDLNELNHTELVLLARWSGLPASRAFSRAQLIHSLETFQPIELPLPLEVERESLRKWLLRWWPQIKMQAPKKVCPRCDQCRELQVLDCYVRNEAKIRPGPARR